MNQWKGWYYGKSGMEKAMSIRDKIIFSSVIIWKTVEYIWTAERGTATSKVNFKYCSYCTIIILIISEYFIAEVRSTYDYFYYLRLYVVISDENLCVLKTTGRHNHGTGIIEIQTFAMEDRIRRRVTQESTSLQVIYDEELAM